MQYGIISIIAAVFLLGAAGILFINRKKPGSEAGQKLWLKYRVYLVLVSAVVYCLLHTWLFTLLAVVIIGAGLLELIQHKKAFTGSGQSFLIPVILYSIAGAGFLYYACIKNNPGYLFVYMLVFCFDGFSQISGQLLGKHALTPAISPNKTWEGVAGGFACCIIIALCTGTWFSMNSGQTFRFCLLICGSALGGDLMASKFKRMCRIKDYNQLIPGHGGILDRFDSYIAAGSVYGWVSFFIS
ncbi:MAG: phosphatidate cytidylyltransferase [Bacteroidia bacterium]